MTIQYSIPNLSGDFTSSSTEQNSFSSIGGDVSTSTDSIIDFEGFEKYGPPENVTFWQFGAGTANMVVNGTGTFQIIESFLQDWTLIAGSTNGSIGLITGLNGTGTAVAFKNSNFGANSITRDFPNTYSHLIFGFAFMSGLNATVGVQFVDTIGAASQLSIWIDTYGQINVSRSGVGGGNVLYTSPGLIYQYQRYYLEIDFTIGTGTNGAFQVWLNGTLLTTKTGQNTRATSNTSVNQFQVVVNNFGTLAIDDMYWRENTSGTSAPLGDTAVTGLGVTGDSSVQFTSSASVLGPWNASQTVSTNAPGVDLVLVPVTPVVNMTINSVGIKTAATSSIVKFKGVIYSDSAGSPGSLLSSGTEVVGCLNQYPVTMPLVTPQALTAGTQYWIGYITDTSLSIYLSDNFNVVGQKKANTYASGAPAGPLSGMTTGQNPWSIWGNCASATANYPNVNRSTTPIQYAQYYNALCYNSSSTVANKDLFTVADLTATPVAINAVKVSAFALKSSQGARTMNIHCKSGASDSTGSNFPITPSTNAGWFSSRFDTDPAGGPWGSSGVNGMTIGYEVGS